RETSYPAIAQRPDRDLGPMDQQKPPRHADEHPDDGQPALDRRRGVRSCHSLQDQGEPRGMHGHGHSHKHHSNEQRREHGFPGEKRDIARSRSVKSSASVYALPNNPSYVAHGLALLNEIRTWCVVREGRYHKKGFFVDKRTPTLPG